MNEAGIERLAKRLRRPPSGFAALRQLRPEQLQQLEQLVGRACEQQSLRLQADLRHALPWPLRWLMKVPS